MWPSERTALLVIHGIGQQNTFDTLDGFVRTLAKVLQENNEDSQIAAWHRLMVRDGERENYVSLVRNDDQDTTIDVFEYYWAHETEGKVEVREVFDWLVETSEGARRFYEENIDLVQTYEAENVDAFGKDRKFKRYWYMKYASFAFRIGRLLLNIRIPNPIAAAIVRLLSALTRPAIVDYVGDVALYTTTDRKSKHYDVRRAILSSAVDRLKHLLASEAPEYGRIIVAGHSLGSVIGYDALNRINQSMNAGVIDPALADRLKGFVSFGSPLDKIAFFFRQRADNDQIVKRQILKNLHAFKTKDWDPISTEKLLLQHDFVRYLDNISWLNYWDPQDPIGGHLDFYDIASDGNVKVDTGRPWGAAHVGFWGYKPMYEAMAQRLLSAERT